MKERSMSRRKLLQLLGVAGIASGVGAAIGAGKLRMASAPDCPVACAQSIRTLLSLTANNGDLAVIAGYHEGSVRGGGGFVYIASISRSEHNGGSIIDPTASFPSDWHDQSQRESWYNHSGAGMGCWVRSAGDAELNADDFGARPEEPFVVDTEAMNAYISALHSDGTVRLGDGTYRFNVLLPGGLCGNGYDTVIMPADTSRPAITLYRRIATGDWRWRFVRDFRYDGINRGAAAISYPTFDDSPVDGRMVGRYEFARILFANCLAAIRKPQGNIGNVYKELTVMHSHYGIWSSAMNSDPSMHEGNDHYIRCHMGPGIDRACFRYDLSTRQGSSLDIILDGCISEYVDGFGLLTTGGDPSGVATGSISIRGGWFERVAGTGAPVDIDGTMRTPYEISLTHVRNASASGVLLESIELIHASLKLTDCQLSDITGISRMRVSIDQNSVLTSERDNSQFGRPQNMLVTSIGSPHRTARGGAWMPLRTARSQINFGSEAQNISFHGNMPIPSVSHPGSIVSNPVEDGVLSKKSVEFTIPAGTSVSLTPPYMLTPGRYVVMSVHLRNMTGDVHAAVKQAGGIVLTNEFKADLFAGWRCLSTLALVIPRGDNRVALTLSDATEISKVRVADWQIIQFNRLEDATAYHNSLMCLSD